MIKRSLVMVDGDIFNRCLTKNNVFAVLGLCFLLLDRKRCLINCIINETNAYRKFSNQFTKVDQLQVKVAFLLAKYTFNITGSFFHYENLPVQ